MSFSCKTHYIALCKHRFSCNFLCNVVNFGIAVRRPARSTIGKQRSRSSNTKTCVLPEQTLSDLCALIGPGFYLLRERKIAGYPLWVIYFNCDSNFKGDHTQAELISERIIILSYITFTVTDKMHMSE